MNIGWEKNLYYQFNAQDLFFIKLILVEKLRIPSENSGSNLN